MSEKKAWYERWRWLFMTVVTLAALVWTILLLRDALPELRADLPRLQAWWLLLPMAGLVACGYIGFEAFRALLLHVKPQVYGRLALGHLYFVAQLMKHLPGRVWGIAYQTTAGNQVNLAVWASVTVTHMVIATGVAVWMAMAVMGFAYSPELGALALVSGLAAYAIGWQRRPLTMLLALISRLPGRMFARAGSALLPFVEASFRFKLRILLLFGSYWLIYLVSWAGYGLAWPGLSPADGMVLCALYVIAWMAGYFSLITPSGLGVRELVFVFLAHRFPPDAVAGLAIFGRAMLLVADILLGAIYGPFVPAQPKTTNIDPAPLP